MTSHPPPENRPVSIPPRGLKGLLAVPQGAKGLVVFAHGSGSGRFSPRNNHVARALQSAGFATLLLDLLTPHEETERANVFDIPLLASRLAEATDWAQGIAELKPLPVGYFGASTGAGAALVAAAADPRVRAVVSRGGRPDLAGSALSGVKAPTLLIVGSRDVPVLELNRRALERLTGPKALVVVPGASHLFEEPGTLDRAVVEARRWFDRHLAGSGAVLLPFEDRMQAGQLLGERLLELKAARPLVLALPRGGVPVAFEAAKAIDADLDLLLVRKLGAPGYPELGIGALVDGADPQLVLNRDIVGRLALRPRYIEEEADRQLRELERRRRAYLGDRPAPRIDGRTVIVIDDGVATGGTVRAALKGIRRNHPGHLILAVPVAPLASLAGLAAECDELVCLAAPEPFHSVGACYRDFRQTSDEEVRLLLAAASRARQAATAAA